ncbi:MAG: BrnT family toxin [Chthoniobacteraceae bacterium]
MEFDWLDSPFDLHKLTPREIEESFEDPFSLRLMPDVEIAGADAARYFNLGKSIEGRAVFTIFRSDGKKIRCLLSREMTPEEVSFFERKTQELN